MGEMSEQVKVTSVALTRQQYGSRYVVAEEIMAAIKGGDLRAREVVSTMSDQVITNMAYFIASQQLAELDARFPSNWVESLKDRFFPEWLKKKYPVKMTYLKLEAKALYPYVAMPNERHMVVMMSEQSNYLMPEVDE